MFIKYLQSATFLSVLYAYSSQPPKNMWGHYSHFINEEIEAQRNKETCPNYS